MSAQAGTARNGENGLVGKAQELASELFDVKRKVAEARDTVAETVSHARETISHARDTIADNVEDSRRNARRAMKRGKYLAEDFVDTASMRVRRDPMSSVGMAFAGGVIVGSLTTLIFCLPRRER